MRQHPAIIGQSSVPPVLHRRLLWLHRIDCSRLHVATAPVTSVLRAASMSTSGRTRLPPPSLPRLACCHTEAKEDASKYTKICADVETQWRSHVNEAGQSTTCTHTAAQQPLPRLRAHEKRSRRSAPAEETSRRTMLIS